MSLTADGTPAARASSAGSPYPSDREGNANADAARYTAGSSSSSTSGTSRTRSRRPSRAISAGSGSRKFRSKYPTSTRCTRSGRWLSARTSTWWFLCGRCAPTARTNSAGSR